MKRTKKQNNYEKNLIFQLKIGVLKILIQSKHFGKIILKIILYLKNLRKILKIKIIKKFTKNINYLL